MIIYKYSILFKFSFKEKIVQYNRKLKNIFKKPVLTVSFSTRLYNCYTNTDPVI